MRLIGVWYLRSQTSEDLFMGKIHAVDKFHADVAEDREGDFPDGV